MPVSPVSKPLIDPDPRGHPRGFFYVIIFHMAEPSHDELLQETYKLARDNNRMLHAMRRNSFIGSIFKLIMYVVFVGVPLWFFATYLYPVLNNAMSTLNQVQGQMQNVQGAGAQFGGDINKLLEQVKNIPGVGNFGQ